MIIEVISKLNKRVRLTEVQWAHIQYKHKELNAEIQKIELALKQPDIIYYSKTDVLYYYYKHFDQTPVSNKYLLLVVKHLNGEGFVVTAFFCSKIRKANMEAVYGEENIHKL